VREKGTRKPGLPVTTRLAKLCGWGSLRPGEPQARGERQARLERQQVHAVVDLGERGDEQQGQLGLLISF
jgi:hypothetical protein